MLHSLQNHPKNSPSDNLLKIHDTPLSWTLNIYNVNLDYEFFTKRIVIRWSGGENEVINIQLVENLSRVLGRRKFRAMKMNLKPLWMEIKDFFHHNHELCYLKHFFRSCLIQCDAGSEVNLTHSFTWVKIYYIRRSQSP